MKKKWLQTYKNGTKTKQLVRECQEIWNVSTADFDYLNSDAFSAFNVTQNIKVIYCFKLTLFYLNRKDVYCSNNTSPVSQLFIQIYVYVQ